MILDFFSRQMLDRQPSVILKGLLLQRLLIISIALLALLFENFSDVQDFLVKPGFTITLILGSSYCLLSMLRLRKTLQPEGRELFLTSLLDSLLLIFLVSFSGASSNPFIYYLLVQIAVAALLFQGKRIWIFSGFSVLCYTALFYADLFQHSKHNMSGFQLHLLGMWVNFIASAMLITFFVSRLSTALRDGQQQLAEAREANLKNEQLIGIGTLAASTVHALRTPLSTMAVLLSDLKSEQHYKELDEDFALLLKQIERCKQTTDKLAALADKPDDLQAYENPEQLFAFLQENYQIIHSRVELKFYLHDERSEKSKTKAGKISQHILLKQALLNLIDNALQAAQSKVRIDFTIMDASLHICILDDGDGIPEHILANWGKPFFSNKEAGLGIGIFLANSTIERFKGRIDLKTQAEDRTFSTQVNISLPLFLADELANEK